MVLIVVIPFALTQHKMSPTIFGSRQAVSLPELVSDCGRGACHLKSWLGSSLNIIVKTGVSSSSWSRRPNMLVIAPWEAGSLTKEAVVVLVSWELPSSPFLMMMKRPWRRMVINWHWTSFQFKINGSSRMDSEMTQHFSFDMEKLTTCSIGWKHSKISSWKKSCTTRPRIAQLHDEMHASCKRSDCGILRYLPQLME